MPLIIDIPFSASVSVSLLCLNIAEKALPISHGIEPGPMSEFSVVISIILLRSGSPTITEINAEVSITISNAGVRTKTWTTI